MRRLSFTIGGFATFLAACARRTDPVTSFTILNDASEPLRTAFNGDRGKVRVLMLVGPT